VTDSARGSLRVVAETAVVGIALGALMGLIWWWLAPSEEWRVVKGGALVPAEIGFDAWFAADGWFLVLGAIAGVLLTLITWRRGRGSPVALAVGVIVGGALLALTAWSLGGLLGPPDPKAVADTAELGTTVEGALGLRALGVMCAPLLTALTTLALLVASARVDETAAESVPPVDGAGVPQQSW
jgi:hypothetical protein